ncbi:hypothetical protein [Massilia violaceinigra]|uniref:hypothetical protein n=1 Tax=Massilia violaceinigra TaxID=2045208 RepID=UPI0012FD5B42|nr:hypothetical protein [Massilia violaceinigra]
MIIYHNEDVDQLRRAAYPPLADLADAMYWQSRGQSGKMDEYNAAVEAVKARYPKP